MNAINDRDINKMAATALANFGSHGALLSGNIQL